MSDQHVWPTRREWEEGVADAVDRLPPLSETATRREWEEGVAARLDVLAGMVASVGDQLARLEPLAEAMAQLAPVFEGLKPENNGGKQPGLLQLLGALRGGS